MYACSLPPPNLLAGGFANQPQPECAEHGFPLAPAGQRLARPVDAGLVERFGSNSAPPSVG